MEITVTSDKEPQKEEKVVPFSVLLFLFALLRGMFLAAKVQGLGRYSGLYSKDDSRTEQVLKFPVTLWLLWA